MTDIRKIASSGFSLQTVVKVKQTFWSELIKKFSFKLILGFSSNYTIVHALEIAVKIYPREKLRDKMIFISSIEW